MSLVTYYILLLLLILYNILLILVLISNLHRWKNYWIRGVLSLAMISGFFLIIYMGPIALILVVSVFFGGVFGCKKNTFMFCTVFVKTQNEAHSLNLLLVAELCSHVSALLPSSDPGHVCPNQVFPRNYHHWLQSLPFL